MKARLLAPLLAGFVCLLCFIGINVAFSQPAASDTQLTSYLIKPLQNDRVFYVQPRLALGNLAPESLWASLEELAQRYYINDSKLQIRAVNGRAIPGLIVFTEALNEAATPSELIATNN